MSNFQFPDARSGETPIAPAPSIPSTSPHAGAASRSQQVAGLVRAPGHTAPPVVSLAGVPMDLGASCAGAHLGPIALRTAGVVPAIAATGVHVHDAGSLASVRYPLPGESMPALDDRLRLVMDACSHLSDVTALAAMRRQVPFVLGGDHALAAGSIAGVARVAIERGERIGVLHVDAHPDCCTPQSSVSGNPHGMPIAHLLGYGHPEWASLVRGRLRGASSIQGPALLPDHLAYIGARDIDPPEAELLRELGIYVATMDDVAARGWRYVTAEALERVTSSTAGVYVSFDLDAFDPTVAPGVGTPVPGGLTREAGLGLMEMVATHAPLVGLDLVELNPLLDVAGVTTQLGLSVLTAAARGLVSCRAGVNKTDLPVAGDAEMAEFDAMTRFQAAGAEGVQSGARGRRGLPTDW